MSARSSVQSISWAPLRNFRSAIKAVSFSDSVRVRTYQSMERRRAASEAHLGLDMQVNLLHSSHVIEYRQDATKTRHMGDEPFASVVSTLRLLGPGDVGFNYVGSRLVYQEHGAVKKRMNDSGMWTVSRPPLGRDPYVFEPGNSKKVGRIFKSLQQLQDLALLRALDRFNFAYERRRPGDRLVDYWIALESLFLKGDERQELSYRASLRMARYIGQSASERGTIFNCSRSSYTARSNIVHGSRKTDKVDDIVSVTGGILRRCLLRAVIDGRAPPLGALDEAIAGDRTNRSSKS